MDTINFNNSLNFERETFLILEGIMVDNCTDSATVKIVDFNDVDDVFLALERVLEEFKSNELEVIDGLELVNNELYYSIEQCNI